MKLVFWTLLFILSSFWIGFRVFREGTPEILEKSTKFFEPIIMGDKEENVFLFAQISDIHISYREPENVVRYRRLMNHMKVHFKPDFILLTGDLVDSMAWFWLVRQYESEWIDYQRVFHEFNETFDETRFYPSRGNHDGFGEPNPLSSKSNFYNVYSLDGNTSKSTRVSSFVHEKPYGRYSFVGFDANIYQATMINPHAFFGTFYQKDMDLLEAELKYRSNSNHTLVYNHYPISVIQSESTTTRKDFFTLFREYNVIAHISGHMHNCYGLCPFLKANFPEGHLEIEVMDMKVNQKYRLATYDHDIFTFTDVLFHEHLKPVIHVTNPKEAMWLSRLEPHERIRISTHMRMYVFSEDPIARVVVNIDGSYVGEVSNPTKSFIAIPWNVTAYLSGFHQFRVDAYNVDGNFSFVEYTINLEGQLPPLTPVQQSARNFLGVYWSIVLQILFILMYSVVALSLIALKLWHAYVVCFTKKLPEWKNRNFIVKRLILFAGWDFVIIPYLIIYLVFPFYLWELYIFGIFELLHTFFPILLYFFYVSGSRGSYSEFFITPVFFFYVLFRIFDCIWHFTIWHPREIIWPLTGFELWIMCLLVIIIRDSHFIFTKIRFLLTIRPISTNKHDPINETETKN